MLQDPTVATSSSYSPGALGGPSPITICNHEQQSLVFDQIVHIHQSQSAAHLDLCVYLLYTCILVLASGGRSPGSVTTPGMSLAQLQTSIVYLLKGNVNH
jgi:hypothetical protein